MSDLSTPFRKGQKVQITLVLEPEQVDDLDLIAARQKRSRTAVVRLAIDTYLKLHSVEPDTVNVA